jgi:hypothetical protein
MIDDDELARKIREDLARRTPDAWGRRRAQAAADLYAMLDEFGAKDIAELPPPTEEKPK